MVCEASPRPRGSTSALAWSQALQSACWLRAAPSSQALLFGHGCQRFPPKFLLQTCISSSDWCLPLITTHLKECICVCLHFLFSGKSPPALPVSPPQGFLIPPAPHLPLTPTGHASLSSLAFPALPLRLLCAWLFLLFPLSGVPQAPLSASILSPFRPHPSQACSGSPPHRPIFRHQLLCQLCRLLLFPCSIANPEPLPDSHEGTTIVTAASAQSHKPLNCSPASCSCCPLFL